jgi:hypothetical protein
MSGLKLFVVPNAGAQYHNSVSFAGIKLFQF